MKILIKSYLKYKKLNYLYLSDDFELIPTTQLTTAQLKRSRVGNSINLLLEILKIINML